MSNIRHARGHAVGVYYLPVVTNLVAVTLIFQLMFDKYYGVFNYLLQLMGIDPVPWLTNPVWAKVSTSVLIIWRGLGYYVVYTLAGLMSVDRSLYEYATLEGANYLQRQVHITIPSIAPILLYQRLPYHRGLEHLLGTLPAVPQGLPVSSCMTTAIYIYGEGFKNLKFGYGAPCPSWWRW
jgi:ABC-type sugar transport system permease subunit